MRRELAAATVGAVLHADRPVTFVGEVDELGVVATTEHELGLAVTVDIHDPRDVVVTELQVGDAPDGSVGASFSPSTIWRRSSTK